jgi:ADP-L-glycero-D-manno-heptose 6-epimerase
MIIVTGGSGFIGSALIWKLNQEGREDIIIVDDFGTSEKWKNIVSLKFADLFERDEFGHMVADNFFNKYSIETIFHMGAISSTTETNFSNLLRYNCEYTKFLCEKAVNSNIRFIYASSAATYGNGENGYDDDEKDLHKLHPMNGYGYSKHLFDLWALKNGYLDKIAGLKFFNVFGPNEYHKGEMRSVVNKAYHQLKETGKIRLFKSSNKRFEDGEQKRDFVYIKDVIDMTLFFQTNKLINGIFNIGSGKANSFNDFVKPVFKALKIKENIEYFEMPEILKGKYQDYTQANMEKMRIAGYNKQPTFIESAVSDYVVNYLNTDQPYLS